jgi:hypothetical protein
MQKSKRTNSFTFSGYLEMYYSYDFGKPSNHEDRFIYSHNKHNEVNLNLGLIKVNYERIMFEEFCFNGGDISSV